jgi:hypothetical protein
MSRELGKLKVESMEIPEAFFDKRYETGTSLTTKVEDNSEDDSSKGRNLKKEQAHAHDKQNQKQINNKDSQRKLLGMNNGKGQAVIGKGHGMSLSLIQ